MDDDDYEIEAPAPLPEVKRISGIYLQEAANDLEGLQRVASAPRPTLPPAPFSDRIGEIVRSPGFKGRLVALAVLFATTGGMWSGGMWLAADFTRGAYQVAPQAIGSMILMMFAAVLTLALVGLLGAGAHDSRALRPTASIASSAGPPAGPSSGWPRVRVCSWRYLWPACPDL